jgi:hypothetical protein
MAGSVLWSRSFEVVQNADAPFSLGFASPSSTGQLSLATPYVFTATTVKFCARESSNPSSPLLVELTSTSGAITFSTATVAGVSSGFVNFNIPNATTVNLPVGVWYADLLWENGSTNTYLAAGPFIVLGTAGR